MIGLSRQAQSLAELPTLPRPVLDSLRRLAADASAATRRARDLSHLLACDDFTHASFGDVLQAHIQQLEHSLGLTCELTLDDSFPLADAETGLHLVRIVREAVTNAARHAGARRVWLDFLNRPAGATITISNDGRPPAPAPQRRDGLGLRQMRMRAALLGAELSLAPGSPDGAVLQLTFGPDAGMPATDRQWSESHSR